MAQTFQQLQKQIEILKNKAEQLRRGEFNEVVAKIKVAIEAYGISRQDLFGTSGAGSPGKQVRGGPVRRTSAKFSDGKGNTWVGLGKRPQWLRDALTKGAKLEDFLGRSGSGTADAGAASAAGQAGKKFVQRKGGKAMYRDDAGNAWSGRGPRPRWLKEALASGKELDDLKA